MTRKEYNLETVEPEKKEEEQTKEEETQEIFGETKEEKFVRLATARVNKILKGIDTLKNLSGTTYKSTEDQRVKMFTILRNAVDEAQSAFERHKEAKVTFTFDV